MQNKTLFYPVGAGVVGMRGGDACVTLVEVCVQAWRDESASWCHPDLTFVILSASEESQTSILHSSAAHSVYLLLFITCRYHAHNNIIEKSAAKICNHYIPPATQITHLPFWYEAKLLGSIDDKCITVLLAL